MTRSTVIQTVQTLNKLSDNEICDAYLAYISRKKTTTKNKTVVLRLSVPKTTPKPNLNNTCTIENHEKTREFYDTLPVVDETPSTMDVMDNETPSTMYVTDNESPSTADVTDNETPSTADVTDNETPNTINAADTDFVQTSNTDTRLTWPWIFYNYDTPFLEHEPQKVNEDLLELITSTTFLKELQK